MARAEVILAATIDVEVMARHSAASPLSVGIELAHQVQQALQQDALNYVPALDYFREKELVDSELLEVYDSLVWLGEQLTKTELRTRLRSVFAQIESADIQPISDTLSKLRPGSTNFTNQLAEHYTPNHFQVHLRGILTPRMADTPLQSAVLFALRDSFQYLHCIHSDTLS